MRNGWNQNNRIKTGRSTETRTCRFFAVHPQETKTWEQSRAAKVCCEYLQVCLLLFLIKILYHLSIKRPVVIREKISKGEAYGEK